MRKKLTDIMTETKSYDEIKTDLIHFGYCRITKKKPKHCEYLPVSDLYEDRTKYFIVAGSCNSHYLTFKEALRNSYNWITRRNK